MTEKWPGQAQAGMGPGVSACLLVRAQRRGQLLLGGRETAGLGGALPARQKNDTRQDRGRGEGRRRLGGGQEVGLGCGRNWDRIASLSDSCMHVERNKHRQLSGGAWGHSNTQQRGTASGGWTQFRRASEERMDT